MPEDEFIGMMKYVDVFDLVKLADDFSKAVKNKLAKHPLLDEKILEKLAEEVSFEEISGFIENEKAEPIYFNER